MTAAQQSGCGARRLVLVVVCASCARFGSLASKKEIFMAEKLKIISLGGLNEVGKNMTVFEYKNDILVVDCGVGFPDGEMYGVDVVLPNIAYLEKNQDRIRGIVLTHGHEDHIGSLPYVLSDINAPLYATDLTAGLIKLKLEEHKLLDIADINVIKPGSVFKVGCFTIEAIHVNHSIAGAVALAITTPVGVVLHTGDFKIDATPIGCPMIDLTRFGELGKKGVLCMLSDSTNAERKGFCSSELTVGKTLEEIFDDCKSRVIVTTFASNVYRIQQVISVSAKFGRKVAITGRSMENMIKVSAELGYLEIPRNTLIELGQIKNFPKEQITVITTGSQGESMSALYRMAFGGHRQIEIQPGDRVVISASAVPGNEKTVSNLVNELFKKGAEVLYRDCMDGLHVSGHACQEELKIMLGLIQPKFFIPIHGEQRHLRRHAELAKSVGIPAENIVISDIGKVIELSRRSIGIGGVVPSGKVLVDGAGIGDVGSVVLRDRKHLAQDGMLVVVLSLSSQDGGIISGPDIITRGFVYMKEASDLMEEMRMLVTETIEACNSNGINDWSALKNSIKTALSSYLYKTTRRSPMILPMIMEV